MTYNQNHLRPNTHLIGANKRYPHAWKWFDKYIQQYHNNWPQWCFLPTEAVLHGKSIHIDEVDYSLLELPILSAWRATQGVYRFDPDVIEPLWDTSIKGNIPTDVLFRMPEWCVYVETGKRDLGNGIIMYGFFACLDFTMNVPSEQSEQSEWLAILLDVEREKDGKDFLITYNFPLKISAGVSPTIEELISVHMNDKGDTFFPPDPILWKDPIYKAFSQNFCDNILPRIFSLLIYLCSENAEYRGTTDNTTPSKYPAPTMTKNGPRFFPPSKPAVWNTAWRIGASIRSYREKSTASNENELGSVMRPHIRRAHWHSYWTGSLESERNILIKWLPPIPVNVDSTEDLIPTVRGVE